MSSPTGQKGRAMTITTSIPSFGELTQFLGALPDGTTCDILASDLEAGNFETAHLKSIFPFEVQYSGSVAEGYASPFQAESKEADLDARAEYSDALRKLKWD